LRALTILISTASAATAIMTVRIRKRTGGIGILSEEKGHPIKGPGKK
jgi:hypothetical protein